MGLRSPGFGQQQSGSAGSGWDHYEAISPVANQAAYSFTGFSGASTDSYQALIHFGPMVIPPNRYTVSSTGFTFISDQIPQAEDVASGQKIHVRVRSA